MYLLFFVVSSYISGFLCLTSASFESGYKNMEFPLLSTSNFNNVCFTINQANTIINIASLKIQYFHTLSSPFNLVI